jgi:Tfp pilus assembly ATPase PilU
MNQSLADLYLTGKITLNDAMNYSSNTQELSEMLSKHKSPAFS